MTPRLPTFLHALGALKPAALALPVIVAGAMMFAELGHIGLTIAVGRVALDRALERFHVDAAAPPAPAVVARQLRTRMAAASHQYLDDGDIPTVAVERFASLDTIGAAPANTRPAAPVWRVTVEIRRDFLTPLPRLLGVGGNAFRYQYQRLVEDPQPRPSGMQRGEEDRQRLAAGKPTATSSSRP